MHRPKPNRLHDELDALLDGRPFELTDELAPMVEAADNLRAELAALRLDPEVARRHLERVLERPGNVVQMPVRRSSGGWDVRRRVVAVALAAALVLAPATIASAAALPGQAMYPFKLAIEQVRIASVQWSPSREAGERTRVADERLDEVESLVSLKMFGQLPGALRALKQAVVAAQVAVAEAQKDGEPVATVASKLIQVKAVGRRVVEQVGVAAANGSINLTGDTRQAVQDAVQESQGVLRPTPAPDTASTDGTPTPTTPGSPPNTAPTEPTNPPTTTPPTTNPPTTNPPTTNPPTTNPPTTNPPTTNPPTTNPPTTATQESVGRGRGGDLAGSNGKSAKPSVPPTTTTLAP